MTKNKMFTTALALACLLWSGISAVAGDFASREILGFSPDGSRFAFEEYGTQDGSGFPYSNIYVIDTTTDQWVAGSPFRVRIDNEQAGEDEVRAEARRQAGSTIDGLSASGLIIATNPHTEVQADPHRIVASPVAYEPSGRPNLEFRLETYEVQGEDYCSLGGAVKAFRLLQVFETPGSATRLLHDDGSTIPKSRSCALGYEFADLIVYQPFQGKTTIVVLIRYRQLGFEGPNGRYIAITLQQD